MVSPTALPPSPFLICFLSSEFTWRTSIKGFRGGGSEGGIVREQLGSVIRAYVPSGTVRLTKRLLQECACSFNPILAPKPSTQQEVDAIHGL